MAYWKMKNGETLYMIDYNFAGCLLGTSESFKEHVRKWHYDKRDLRYCVFQGVKYFFSEAKWSVK